MVATEALPVGVLDAGELDNVSGTAGYFSLDTIIFDAGVFPDTISLGSALPVLTAGGDTVNASGAGVVVDGVSELFDCFLITSDANVIKGLQIEDCDNGIKISGGAENNIIGGTGAGERNVISSNATGIRITDAGAQGNVVKGNYIGTNLAGTAANGNIAGIRILGSADANIIGGSTGGERNVISGNTSFGVHIDQSGTDGNIVKGNYIGTNAGGTAPVTNANGVIIHIGPDQTIVGGSTAGERNVVSGNTNGVRIFGSGSDNNTVIGNYIGMNASGSAAISNAFGVLIEGGAKNNTVGGTSAGARNVISGNETGVHIAGGGTTGNTVRGNYIGTNPAGSAAIRNEAGVKIDLAANGNTVGGSTSADRNVISGNYYSSQGIGVQIGGAGTTSNVVAGNYIGIDAGGAFAVPNGAGVQIEGGATANTIGGASASAKNVISGNTIAGLRITGSGTSGNAAKGNYIGTDPGGSSAIANVLGVRIDTGAGSNTIGGGGAGEGNVISGNSTQGVRIEHVSTVGNIVAGNRIGTNAAGTSPRANQTGVQISFGVGNIIGGDSPGEGNVISGNALQGVDIRSGSGNFVSANYIGVNADGTGAIANQTGVFIESAATNNTVGGPTSGERNIISGNRTGVHILGGGNEGNVIKGNYIGLDATGTGVIANSNGVVIDSGAANNTVGGGTGGERNIISGNTTGVYIFGFGTSGNAIKGNYIGTNVAGGAAMPNVLGVRIEAGASGTVVGGGSAGDGNVISGNTIGVFVTGAMTAGNLIQGNNIGTNAAGGGVLANVTGVRIEAGATGTVLGGPAGADRNLISGNTTGVIITGSGTTGNAVKGNRIGTDVGGSSPLPNGAGVLIDAGASANSVGGIAAGEENVIAYNSGDGVRVQGASSTGNSIRGNSIHSNGAKGIENISGGNTELTPPTITAVGSANGTACANCQVDVFSDSADEGRVYHGSTTANGSGAWSFGGAVVGPYITGTATNASGNTSEFSVPCAAVDSDCDTLPDAGDNCPFVANLDQADGDLDGVGNVCDNCPSTPNPGQENNVHPLTFAGDHCEDFDVDGLLDINDNCPSDFNPLQQNTDLDLANAGARLGKKVAGVIPPLVADGLGDACDPDRDNDSLGLTGAGQLFFRDAREAAIGTDPSLTCPTQGPPGTDPWPPNFNGATGDTVVNPGDMVLLAQVMNSSSPTPPYVARRDLSADGFINAGDMVIFSKYFITECS